VIHVADARALRAGAEDEQVLAGAAGELQLERDVAGGVRDGKPDHRVGLKRGDGRRLGHHGLADDSEVGIDGDRDEVARQPAGAAEDGMGAALAADSVPGGELRVGQGAPEGAGTLEGCAPFHLPLRAGIARNGFLTADLTVAVLVGDCIAQGACLRDIADFHGGKA